MKLLQAGDIRQEGDEVMRSAVDGTGTRDRPYDLSGVWAPVRLIGFPILESDLIVSKFRRP